MKVGLIYTVSTPEMCQYRETRMRAILGQKTKCLMLAAPEILGEVMQAGSIPPSATRRLLKLYLQAMDAGCEAILNICSSVSPVAEAMAALNPYLGAPVVSIDAAMCARAAALDGPLAVVATLPTALASTVQRIATCARQNGRAERMSQILIEGGFASVTLKEAIIASIREQAADARAIVFAQASMANLAEDVQRELGIPVFASPDFGFYEIKRLQAQNAPEAR